MREEGRPYGMGKEEKEGRSLSGVVKMHSVVSDRKTQKGMDVLTVPCYGHAPSLVDSSELLNLPG